MSKKIGPWLGLANNVTPDKLQTDQEIRQNIKQLQHFGGFKLHPGQKLYEMVCVSIKGEPVAGLSEDGSFDPEKALVREVIPDETTAIFGVKTLVNDHPDLGKVSTGGKVEGGSRSRIGIVDGNIYEAAINPTVARRKIIKKYFN